MIDTQIELFPESAPELEPRTINLDDILGPLMGPDPEAHLVDSIDQLGLLQRIVVAEDGGKYRVLAGRRRVKACRLLGHKTINAEIAPAGGFSNEEVVTLQENTSRRSNPVSEYHAIKALVDKGFEDAKIAKELGIKPAVVRQRLGLGGLLPVFLDLLETGKIPVGVGEAAAKLTAAQQETLLDKFGEEDKLTHAHVKALKKAGTDAAAGSLVEELFGGGDKRREGVDTALRHVGAAEELLRSLGFAVSFDSLRSEITNLVT